MNTNTAQKIFVYPIFFFFLMSLAAGCASVDAFKYINNDFKPNNDSIAVLSATNKQLNILFAEEMTKEFNKTGKLKAMTNGEISKKLPQYPDNSIDFLTFKGSTFENNSRELFEKNKSNLQNINNQLKTKYILLVWVGRNESSSGELPIDFYKIKSVNTLFVSVPNNKVIGYSDFDYSESFSSFRSSNSAYKIMMSKIAADIVKAMMNNK